MLRDVFYYGAKPNVHPLERFAKNLADARKQSTTQDFWIINEFCDYTNFEWDFDFDFLPDEDVWAQDHNNVWPSQHQKDSGTWLCSKKDSDLIIYRNDVEPVKRKNEKNSNWILHTDIDETKFDFSWHPDPTEPPYIYKWGCKYYPVEVEAVLEYKVSGADKIKYIQNTVELLPQKDRWKIYTEVDVFKFDFSWRPDPREPAYTYVWGNKYEDAEVKPTIEYTVPGAKKKKYMQEKVNVLPEWDRYKILEDIVKDSFDFTWRPDPKEPALIYVFGNEQYDAVHMPTIEYHMPDATERKYVLDNNLRARLSPSPKRFEHLEDSYLEDYSWTPDPKSPPYIYAFGNQWNKPEDKISIQYVVQGATEYKFMDIRAIRRSCMDNWIIPDNIDTTGFDFSWEPSPADPPYIYEFGTQWQKSGGPRYVVKEASEVKYVSTFSVKALPTKDNWTVPSNLDLSDFDFSWHPDRTDPPYIYHFPTQWALTGGPVYTVPGATEKKYLDEPVAKAVVNMDNWEIPDNIDKESFDFSWHPVIEDRPYIYQFGTQHQKTGGPKYHTPGSDEMSPIKYIDRRILKAKALPQPDNFIVEDGIKVKNFDYSWHPDDTEQPFIYVFGNNRYPAEIMPTIRYEVEGAKQVKYISNIVATLDQNKSVWTIPNDIDDSMFDYSWVPNPKDPAYIYEFGTQHQKTGGPRFVVKDATETTYVDSQKVKKLPNRENWLIPHRIDETQFDFSWHPDSTEIAYIYEFGTQWQKNGGPKYVVESATEIKYVDTLKAKRLPNKDNWNIPANIDDSFDFSWHPDNTEPPFIYEFATEHNNRGGPCYVVDRATEFKYVENIKAKLTQNKNNWIIPSNVDVADFDFSWVPHPNDPPYIYEFGTQHQKSGGPKYVVSGATDIKYIDKKVVAKPTTDNWKINSKVKIKEFDFSWHPDTSETPFIYVFGNTLYPAEVMSTIEYVMPGATQVKYVHDIVAKLDSNKDNWIIPNDVDVSDFDFSWIPDPNDPPYIYEFGTQHQRNGGPKYVIEGATEKKYVDIRCKKLPNKSKNFTVEKGIKIKDFDYSWHPDDTEQPYIYVFGNNLYPAEVMPTVRYTVEGATKIKYIDNIKATLDKNKDNWKVPYNVDTIDFDFSWVPNPKDPPYIYEFGTQWQKTGGPQYIVKGATEKKYIDTQKVKISTTSGKHWKILKDISNFDFSWHPDDTEQPYIYVFGNQWHDAIKMPTVEYHVEGATERKYISDIKAILKPQRERFKEYIKVAEDGFDFSWIPDPDEPPYIYVFGNQWNDAEIEPTLEYKVKGAKEIKYVNIKANVASDISKFKVLHPVKDFDFSWRPNPKDPAYIYVFGNQWYDAIKDATIEYHVDGATDRKYVQDLKATVIADLTNWIVPEGIDTTNFDFSWRPDPDSPKYIYQFGTLSNDEDGPRYITPDNNGEVVRLMRIEIKNEIEQVNKYYITTTLEDLVNEHPNEVFWALNTNIDYSAFDFNWRPSIEQARYVHVFGSPDSQLTQTYFVSAPMYLQGSKDFNFVEQDKKVDSEYLSSLFKPSDMFFVDRGNSEANDRFNILKEKFGNRIQKTRYLNSWVDTINRCINRSSTNLCWILNSELDYSNFNFNWYPDPWQLKMVHVFGTQWSHWGTTFMVNRDSFSEDTKYIKIIEHLSNLNFVKDRRAFATNNLYDIYVIDHGNKELDRVVDVLKGVACGKQVNVVKYDTNYLQTIKKIVNDIAPKKEHYIWICSSICNYSAFDLSYICDPFAKENLHVFPSDQQKFGDTFLLDVNHAKTVINELQILQQYNKVNYNGTIRTKRLPAPVIKVNTDTHVGSINTDFDFPYAIYTTEDFNTNDTEPMNLWQEDTKELLVTSTGGTRIIVPKEAKDFIKNELYDYPYIKTASKLLASKPLDIVYLSNGEKCAEENYEHLLAVTKGLKNRIVRVDGINGRVEAYHASAKASNTPWAFTVFAKLKVDTKFDWGWQPDRLQIPKHYIFHAKNPVNGLEYGHQGMIAYNKQLVLNNFGDGLDFTLDDPHETVELLSGIATFNTDAYSTWRTAFREVIKLKSDYTDIAAERLKVWLSKAKGKFAKDCLSGANDAVEYYTEVHGDMDKLKLSYEWSCLKDYYNRKYK